MQIKYFSILTLAIAFCLSANAQTKKTPVKSSAKKETVKPAVAMSYKHDAEMGFDYFIHTDGKNPKIKEGEAISGNQTSYMIRKNSKTDSMLASEPIDAFQVKKAEPNTAYTYRMIMKVLLQSAKSDSISVKFPADSLHMQDPNLKPGDVLKFNIKIKDVLSEADFNKKMQVANEEAKTRMLEYAISMKLKNAEQAAKDSADIVKYIKENKLKAKRTASGLYYVIDRQGTGDTLHPGNNPLVHYTGKLLDGKVFDSSVKRGQPFQVQMGMGRVIIGWEEGLMHFNKGSKGLLIIPSYLGYGTRGAGADIPPNSPLVFEIEIMDVQ